MIFYKPPYFFYCSFFFAYSETNLSVAIKIASILVLGMDKVCNHSLPMAIP